MLIQRGSDGSDPLRGTPIAGPAGARQDRLGVRSGVLGTGTLACRRCDAPVALGDRVASLTDDLHCPFCGHAAAVRDFLSLATPSRPARVEVRVVPRARGALRRLKV